MHISLLPLPPSLSYLSFPLPSPNPSLSLRSSTQLRCQWFRKPSLPVRRGWSGPHVSFLPSTTTNTLDSLDPGSLPFPTRPTVATNRRDEEVKLPTSDRITLPMSDQLKFLSMRDTLVCTTHIAPSL
ncbi:hypothetical protein GBAR_LOCUS30873 [Geodia barretti]|uniref:Uncharacterized protein n=1 Tax=Geodia barretti TaxID=519541 RepID=A0AA35XGJ3_GEOBA|nr:hypothetical protein GBAR_LOCUS30873 [Geodia barretti]